MTTGRNTPSRFMLKEPKLSPRLMGNLAPMETLPFTLYFLTIFLIKTKTQFRSIQKQTPDEKSDVKDI